MLIRRILRNAQDSSPGSGSAPPSAPTTSATSAVTEPTGAPAPQPPPAQGSPVDIAAITKSITDGVFATLRRSGVLPGKPAQPSSSPDGAGSPPVAHATAPTLDARQGRVLDRALTRAGFAANLDERAYQRVERSFADETPDDVDGWVRDYFEGLGIKRVASAPATAATTTTTTTIPPPAAPAAATASAPTTPPASDRGAPPPSSIPLEERKLQEMGEGDRNEYLRRHGAKKYAEKLARDLVGSKVW